MIEKQEAGIKLRFMGIVVTAAKVLCASDSGNKHECIWPGFSNAMTYL